MSLQAKTSVLFVSRRNTARSILAESSLRHLGGDRFNAFSCEMRGEVGAAPHVLALQALSDAGISMRAAAGQGRSSFQNLASKRMDFVIVLADDIAEELPAWPGQPNTATWAYPDALAPGLSAEQSHRLMIQILHSLRHRIEIFISLPMRHAERATLRDDVRDLAHLDRIAKPRSVLH